MYILCVSGYVCTDVSVYNERRGSLERPQLACSHNRFKNGDNGPRPEIRRPATRTCTHSHEQSEIPVLSIGASMSALTDLRWTSVS